MTAPTASVSTPCDRGGQWSEAIRQEPLKAVAAALALGFIFGGGASTRVGYAAAAFAGRYLMRQAGLKLVTGLVGTSDGNCTEYRDNA